MYLFRVEAQVKDLKRHYETSWDGLQADVLKQLPITAKIQKNSLNAYETPIGQKHGGLCGLSDIREVLCIGFLKPKRFHKTDGKQNLKILSLSRK